MRLRRRSSNPSERDLVGLADGSLRGQRRAEVEQALEASPRLRSAVAAQREVLTAIERAHNEAAPPSLRARMALARPPVRPIARRRLIGLMAAGSAVAAAVVVVVAVGLTGGGPVARPTVLQAALLSDRTAEAPVGLPESGAHTLAVRAGGLSYPSWEEDFGFRASGIRHDRLGGQMVTTVFYSRGSHRLAYEIISGSPLRLGTAATSTTRQGVVLRTFDTPRGPVVTWLRHGHTCVLVGQGTPRQVLLHLAAWREGGRIPY